MSRVLAVPCYCERKHFVWFAVRITEISRGKLLYFSTFKQNFVLIFDYIIQNMRLGKTDLKKEFSSMIRFCHYIIKTTLLKLEILILHGTIKKLVM